MEFYGELRAVLLRRQIFQSDDVKQVERDDLSIGIQNTDGPRSQENAFGVRHGILASVRRAEAKRLESSRQSSANALCSHGRILSLALTPSTHATSDFFATKRHKKPRKLFVICCASSWPAADYGFFRNPLTPSHSSNRSIHFPDGFGSFARKPKPWGVRA